MVNLVNMINILSFSICAYISYVAIKSYLKARKNHETTFFWGLSFFIMAMGYLAITLSPLFDIKGAAWSLHLGYALVLILQASAVSISFFDSTPNKYRTRKITKITLFLMISLLLTISPMFIGSLTAAFCGNCYNSFSHLQVIGIKCVDIMFEASYIAMAIFIYSLFPYKFVMMKNSFLMLAICKSIQLINVSAYCYKNLVLCDLEIAFTFATMILMYMGIKELLAEPEE